MDKEVPRVEKVRRITSVSPSEFVCGGRTGFAAVSEFTVHWSAEGNDGEANDQ
jgi:hypothetical protein